MRVFLASLVLSFCFVNVSQAGILLEPGISYFTGTSKTVETDSTSGSTDLTGLGAGLRLGYRHMGFWGGVDGDFLLSGKSKDSSGSEDVTATTVYLSFGYDFMSRMRVWAGVGVMDSYSIKSDTSTGTLTTTLSGGTPFKMGVGFVVYSHVSLNVEFVSHSFSKYKTDTISEVNLSTAGLESVKNTGGLVSVSFPFSY